MPKKIEDVFEVKGLRRISSLNEALDFSFIADSNYNSNDEFPLYPVTDKANITHGLLNLYGTHWRYLASPDDWSFVRKVDGDTARVFDDILEGRKADRNAIYAFTNKYLNEANSLWTFVPGTRGYDFYQYTLLPIYRRDVADYQNHKRAIKGGK